MTNPAKKEKPNVLKALIAAIYIFTLACQTLQGINDKEPPVSGFRPVYPTQCFSSYENILLYPMVDSLNPKLEWEPFPGAHEAVSSEMRHKDFLPKSEIPADKVTYDLQVWKGESTRNLITVYERKGLQGTRHTLETPLKPNEKYLWSVRARFEIDGKTRVSEWSLAMLPIRNNLYTPRKIAQLIGKVPIENYYRFKTPRYTGEASGLIFGESTCDSRKDKNMEKKNKGELENSGAAKN